MNLFGKILLILAGAFVTLDFTHWTVNKIYDPYEGIFDSALHVLNQLSTLIYITTTIYLLHFIQNKTSTINHKNVIILSLALIMFCIFEWVYMHGPGNIQAGSAHYYQMYPQYVSGLIPAILGFALSTSFKKNITLLVIFYFSLILWVAGPLVIDFMNSSVGGYRGVQSVYNMPIVGSLYSNFSYIFVFGIFLSLPIAPILLIFSIITLYKSDNKYNRIVILSLTISSFFLLYNVLNWGGFILD